jgi:Fe-S oxidoreductase
MLGRTDLLGKLGTSAAPLANAMMGKPGSLPRKLMERVVGIAAQRVLPPYAKQRFTTWFKKRSPAAIGAPQANVSVFPTCIVEYQNPAIGKDLVGIYERNRVTCSVEPGVGCCGAPWLHSGDFDAFRDQARKNIQPLAQAVKSGRDIVVAQPTCSYVLKKDYPAYFTHEPEAADAALIGAHTYDASEYLWRLHKGESTSLDTDFSGGHVPATTSYHVSCHLQAQNIGLKSRDLMKLTGTKITLVNKCSGIDGTWGYRKDNYAIAKKMSKSLAESLAGANSDAVTGDCHLANGAILEDTGLQPTHPLQFIARAYGLPED